MLHFDAIHKFAVLGARFQDTGGFFPGPGKKSLPKITKEDIGLPCDFKHLVSFTGGSKTADVNLSDLEPKLEPGSPLSPFEGTPFFPSAAST